MKKWISIMVMLAMVVTTTMPAASHASMKHEHSEKSAHTETAANDDGDCGHHAQKASHGKQTEHEKPCCEKGVCKCVGGTCHSGLSKIFNNGDSALPLFSASESQFGFANEFVDSALPERLKRPPRA